MAVSSVNSGSSIYGARSANIISGLASGMDTESMIESLVSGMKTKINVQKQKQQKLLWQQEAYRSISDKLVSISNKYTSYSSATNLMSTSFFQPSTITTAGKYADMISATGNSNSNVRIREVTQLAQTESVSFKGLNGVTGVDNKVISASKEVELSGQVDVSNLAGKYLSFQYGNKSFSITFDSNKDYKTLDDVVKEINSQLDNTSISLSGGGSIKMSAKVQASKTNDGKLEFKFSDPNETNTLELLGSSSTAALNALKLTGGSKLTSSSDTITSSEEVKSEYLSTKQPASDMLAGTSMRVTYNGTTATIKMPEKDSEDYKKIFNNSSSNSADAMKSYLQTQFDQAFGYGRVTVDNAGSNGKFKPTFTVQSESDTLSFDSGSLNLVGQSGVFGLERGASNRVNTGKTLGELYGTETRVGTDGKSATIIKNMNDNGKVDANGKALYDFEINGVKIGEYTADTTLATIMSDINKNTQAGVKVSYSKASDQFVFTSTHGGAGGKVEIKGQTTGGKENLASKLFGTVTYEANGDVKVNGQDPSNNSNVNVTRGRDAEMTAIINGSEVKLTSGTNTFNVDGMVVTANGTFSATNASEQVTFNAKVDTDKIVNAVKSFVEDYNAMMTELNTQYTTQPEYKKSYEPLTDDDKADMSDKAIENYEAKAKQGLLFGDRDLSSLSESLRYLFGGSEMSKIGITASTSYGTDKGTISLDETKLRAALESDPNSVASAFADPLGQKTVTKNGTTVTVDDTNSGGVMSRLKVSLDKYAGISGATKGILIEKAGSQYSSLSLLQNSIQTQLNAIDTTIDSLNDKLNDQIDRYTSKFSKLEVLINQMNAQSSYFAGMTGSSY
ncbi:MAG: flagellar filament capping protein FliD [Agathobaculum sp.]|uniref:flagellar filament capping protein FliD n=2 Tax=Agathobaculum sp. TaxID=2048138 RepID=UPI002A826964|nr:flagellar filament capping protein FliD [Agathobaculum sp.]MDY3711639.1 flagellar filament capping protein FliD [Agathobaculum sp.]